MNMTITVLLNKNELLLPIGRGFWIGWDPKDNTFTPGHVYGDWKPDATPSDV